MALQIYKLTILECQFFQIIPPPAAAYGGPQKVFIEACRAIKMTKNGMKRVCLRSWAGMLQADVQ